LLRRCSASVALTGRGTLSQPASGLPWRFPNNWGNSGRCDPAYRCGNKVVSSEQDTRYGCGPISGNSRTSRSGDSARPSWRVHRWTRWLPYLVRRKRTPDLAPQIFDSCASRAEQTTLRMPCEPPTRDRSPTTRRAILLIIFA
jgi:hypothetical protein